MDNNFEAPENQLKSKKQNLPVKKYLKTIGLLIVVAVLIFGAGYFGYSLRSQSADTEISKKKTEIANLTKRISDLQKELNKVDEKKTFGISSCTSISNNNISASKIENIKASITSKNTAALEGYMADTVCFVIAASDGIGDISAANAIKNLTNYIENTNGWKFTPTTLELNSYKAGNYADFFVDGAIIGKSSDDNVLLFSFNDDGKINIIFWSSSQSELM